MEFQTEDGYLGVSLCETKEEKSGLSRKRSQLQCRLERALASPAGSSETSIAPFCLRLG